MSLVTFSPKGRARMELSQIVPYLTGPAAAVFVLIWVVWMQRKDIAELRKIIDAERRRADSSEEAARATYQLMSSLIRTGRE